MRILVFFLLFLRFGGCTKNQIESTTVTAGGPVRLKCPRTKSGTIFWIRAVPGNLPEFLGKSNYSKFGRFTTRTEPGTLVLVINNSGVSDTGVYICMTTGATFLKRTDLTVVDSKRENLTKVHPSDPTPGEHSVFLPCSFFSENTTFGDGTKGSCCGSGPAQPFFSFLCKNIVEASQNDLKYFSWQDSGNSSFRNISSFENLCCSVAKCETGNSSEPKTEVSGWIMWISTPSVAISLLCVFFTVNLIVPSFLIYTIRTIKSQSDNGTEPDVKAVLQLPPSESLRSVTLQCSVLSDSENTPCPRVRNVCWFQSGPDASHPSVPAVLDGSLGGCEDGVKGHSPQKCGSKVSEEISSSHTETFSCVVAACGEVFFGKLNHRHGGTFNSTNILIVLLAVALAASIIVNACLVYLLNSKSSGCCKAAVVGSTGDEETQPREEEVCYAAPVFTRRKARLDRGHIREKETIYADVATEN